MIVEYLRVLSLGTTDTKFDKVKSRRSGVGLGKGDVRETLALTKQVQPLL